MDWVERSKVISNRYVRFRFLCIQLRKFKYSEAKTIARLVGHSPKELATIGKLPIVQIKNK